MTTEQASNKAKRKQDADPRFVAPRIYAIAMNLRRATNLHSRRDTDLPPAAARIMMLLGEVQHMTLSQLADLSALDRGQLSRGLTDLVNQGLVHRKKQGRSVLHSLTPTGAAHYARLLEGADQRNETLLEGITAKDRQQLIAILDLLAERALSLLDHEKSLLQNDLPPDSE